MFSLYLLAFDSIEMVEKHVVLMPDSNGMPSVTRMDVRALAAGCGGLSFTLLVQIVWNNHSNFSINFKRNHPHGHNGKYRIATEWQLNDRASQ